MTEYIDCLIIGHNEMQLSDYESSLRMFGTESGAYRDMNQNLIWYKDKPYTALKAYNLFSEMNHLSDKPQKMYKPISLGDTFSGTIAYLGTYLHRRGFTFDYVNYFQNEKEELAKILSKNNIRAIAITTTLYISIFPILDVISFIKKYNNTAKLIIGGPFIANEIRMLHNEKTIEMFLKSMGADFYVNSYQGEEALGRLLYAIKNNLTYDTINNLYIKNGNIYNKTSMIIENNMLEDNMIDWNLFKDRVGEFLNVRTSISCLFNCSFCGFPQYGGKHQTISCDLLEHELNAISKVGKVKSITFVDDTFNIPIERYKNILRMIIKNNYDFKWNSFFRCQYADKETVDLMRESGCEGVCLGIESANQKILNNMNKKVKVEDYQRGLSLLKERDIFTYVSVIIGFPGETYETVQDTIDFIKEYKPDYFRAKPWYCMPLTPIWKEREKYGIVNSQFEWKHATMNWRNAFDLVDKIFLELKESIFMPQLDFELIGIYYIMNKDKNLEHVNNYIKSFNMGIEERLKNPKQKNISNDVFIKIKDACRNS